MKNQMLEKACRTVMLFCKQNKSTILSCISAAGVVATGVLSARGGIKAEKILAEQKGVVYNEDGLVEDVPPVPKWKTALKLAPALLPPVLTAAGTIALIFVADAQNRQAQAALAGAYAMMAKKLADFRAAVEEVAGPEVVKEADEHIAKARLQEQANDILAEERAEDAKLWYDSWSERYFWATDAEVSDAEYYANRIFRMQGYLTLNELYHLLPLEEVPEGDELGWDEYVGEVCYGYMWIDFEHVVHNDINGAQSCTELGFPFPPHPFYEETIEMEKEYEKLCGKVRTDEKPIWTKEDGFIEERSTE